MTFDYLIVGFGLAGLSMASVLECQGKTFRVIDSNPDSNHRVIGGMYNPVILKRFSPAWQAHEFWQQSQETYRYFENKFDKKYFHPFEMYRILQSVEEQNNWVVASDKAVMSEYMCNPIELKNVNGLHAPFGWGKLKNVGRVAGEEILLDYKNYLIEKELFNKNQFHHEVLEIKEDYFVYQDVAYHKIIFCEGSYIRNNPFFNYLPMKESKGEMLVIEVPELNIDFAIKSGVFMVPMGQNIFIVGATYNWTDKTDQLSPYGQAELEEKLQAFLKLPYKILDYKTGIRPTVADRRPLLGEHPDIRNLFILNGLGTRGIIYAPTLAQKLFDFIEYKTTLDKEIDIQRFNN